MSKPPSLFFTAPELPDFTELEALAGERPVLIVPVGLPGCGKTTFAKNLIPKWNRAICRVSRDEFRAAALLHRPGVYYDPAIEDEIRAKAWGFYEYQLEHGISVFLDQTNLNREKRAKYIQPAIRKGYYVIGAHFDYPIDYILKKNKEREAVVREEVIRDMAAIKEKPGHMEGFDVCVHFTVIEKGRCPNYTHNEDSPQKKECLKGDCPPEYGLDCRLRTGRGEWE